ncbi:hypothetical protein [Aestuariibacter salexigens]|uniref:hypothetical protein n=1 Tax=Aestuariibacter salexigens TaxID=226010 RepID=UPI000404715B|nr:hypothetical protein [Aestuariibacter salexigens]
MDSLAKLSKKHNQRLISHDEFVKQRGRLIAARLERNAPAPVGATQKQSVEVEKQEPAIQNTGFQQVTSLLQQNLRTVVAVGAGLIVIVLLVIILPSDEETDAEQAETAELRTVTDLNLYTRFKQNVEASNFAEARKQVFLGFWGTANSQQKNEFLEKLRTEIFYLQEDGLDTTLWESFLRELEYYDNPVIQALDSYLYGNTQTTTRIERLYADAALPIRRQFSEYAAELETRCAQSIEEGIEYECNLFEDLMLFSSIFEQELYAQQAPQSAPSRDTSTVNEIHADKTSLLSTENAVSQQPEAASASSKVESSASVIQSIPQALETAQSETSDIITSQAGDVTPAKDVRTESNNNSKAEVTDNTTPKRLTTTIAKTPQDAVSDAASQVVAETPPQPEPERPASQPGQQIVSELAASSATSSPTQPSEGEIQVIESLKRSIDLPSLRSKQSIASYWDAIREANSALQIIFQENGLALRQARSAAREVLVDVVAGHPRFPYHYYEVRALSDELNKGELQVDGDHESDIDSLWKFFGRRFQQPPRPAD